MSNNMEQLMQKLVVSKAIMDKSEGIKRNDIRPTNVIENFDIPNAKYNIPQEFLQEQSSVQPNIPNIVRENTKPVGVPTIDAIKNSKLPDEIKKLMMEHPISQPQMAGPTLSDELVEKAARLMRKDSNNYVPESAKQTQTISEKTQQQSNLDYNLLKKIVKEVVEEALSENGLMIESTEKSNEMFSFKVGKHVFEGKITKIKKLS